jgi:2-polyprenyl-3-methyl-5-hydroxy-6-metoxy-1,4-benzoquinol methylase
MNEKTIKEYIRALEHMIGFLNGLLEEDKRIIAPPTNHLESLTNLRFLANSDLWPEAVPPSLLCGDDEDSKLARALGIIQEFVNIDITGKKILDFGCGEGHIAYVASTFGEAQIVVGYDVKEQNWAKFNQKFNNLLTTNLETVTKTGPYDIILVNDVIDHSGDPLKALMQIQKLKTAQGKVLMRCHPWTSRHGTHLYKQLNKAYLHLVFTTDELYEMGLEETATQPALDPLTLYRSLIKEAGFTILKEETVTHPIELFFTHQDEVLRRIKDKWKTSTNPNLANGSEFPKEILEIQFVDYTLV